ncbi:sensor histidine kinase [Falsirhodobacter sp. 20TX0035]|uniref:sensor histidine kinase n=1 Tax=Falsirhodobacter sp. 20TX0035 TaxID=3022019 RepID=UPI002330C835|nr:histidine kinase dimerization/phosphoacceptor domain -containing protein [Falsirhodobacter sp. 20TX0035]MDB6453933.1 histidine kinase dimerization/phosphoacceptor domain -containing protein [Falsirhodobacter sp. 20TX0035]
MTTWKARFGNLTGTLGFRLAFLLAIALLPLGVVSALQSAEMLKESRARSEAALLGETMRAAQSDLLVVQQARGAVSALADVIRPLLQDPAACSVALEALVEESDFYTLAGFTDTQGRMICASSSTGADVSKSLSFRRAIANVRPWILLVPRGMLSGQPVIIVGQPVLEDDGSLRGFISLSLAHDALADRSVTGGGSGPRPELLTFNNEGSVLTSTVPPEQRDTVLPKSYPLKDLATEERDLSFTARTMDGAQRAYAVIPIVPGMLYALGSWPSEGQAVWYLRALPSITLPLVMWICCLLVAFLSVERLVTRHVRVLRSAMLGFGDGKRIIGKMDMTTAPTEIRDLAETFEHMTDTILHDEAEMEDMIHQKEVLLREVHHRVKNNLQLIASIMNMQMRQARSAEAKTLMKGLQERVMSLATIHRGLYQTSGLTDIRADELLVEITRQVVQIATGPGRQIGLEHSFADVRLTPDQAVPLSLLLTEALANALKYAGSHDGNPRLWVSMWREGGTQAVLEVKNTMGPRPVSAHPVEGTGLGAQLLSAFSQQVGGRVDISQNDDNYTLRVTFDVRPLNEGEARISGGAVR